MSELTKNINKFFKSATKTEISIIENEIILDNHLQQVYQMFYIQRKDIDYIAFKTGYSRGKIEADLRIIRMKISKAIEK